MAAFEDIDPDGVPDEDEKTLEREKKDASGKRDSVYARATIANEKASTILLDNTARSRACMRMKTKTSARTP